MHCPKCKTQHQFFQTVAPIVQEETLREYELNKGNNVPLIMAIVQPSHARAIWHAMKLNRAPVSTLLPPIFDTKNQLDVTNVISSGILRHTMMINPTLDDIISPLQTNGWKIVIPPPSQAGIIKIIFAFIIVFFIAYIAYLVYPQLQKLQQRYTLLMIASLIIYFFAVSGGGWLTRNNPPSTSKAPDGSEIWIARESSQLLGAEICKNA